MSETEKSRTAINKLFVESGEKERLLQFLRTRLIESGWNGNLDAYTRDVIRNKNLEKTTLEELEKEVGDYGRAIIKESVKKDVLEQIKKFLDNNLD
ncbi:enhancer of yellow 2 transcription factor-like protein B-like protein [Cokeromyces recurvatus]|uniref:enhancer of yellow 2 transcription factor-like protein B-like protein n=1 Tax=Cokeromyces recurvatus TaxID=90255 RepID=UPI00221F022C|nr:enhancer of yellow 2 transcription factor-like protein B-like protein [Cokeromyces recurvatus]KAI7898109.1 enhancer of yellow 2 transcription factor-like protein B-like protein [Cokeromyces recurvatus]